MLEHLVDHFGRFQLSRQLARNGLDDRFEDVADPAVGADFLALLRLVVRAVGIQVVEQPPCLVLLDVQAGEQEQSSAARALAAWWCPASTTLGWSRMLVPSAVLLMENSSTSNPRWFNRR